MHFPQVAKGAIAGADGTRTKIIAAAMGIFFSTDSAYYSARVAENPEQVKIIDDFFDSLNWDKTNTAGALIDTKSTNKVLYGNLMMMVNMRTRWTYTGSVTTPPCSTTVYWNVVKTIYPIKQRHLNQFKNQMQRGTASGSDKFGPSVTNWRLIQPLGDRVITHIVMPQRGGGSAGVVILLLILIGMCIGIAVCYKQEKLVWVSAPADGKKETEFTDPKNIKETAEAAPAQPPAAEEKA